MSILTTLDEIRNDTAAECRWWNTLFYKERLAYVSGAHRPLECINADWLDIGERNRRKILDAAYAVQCWCVASGVSRCPND